jgi:beta-lactamase class A
MKRRSFLWGSAALLAPPAHAKVAPIAVIADYERSSGGHIGLYAENIHTGVQLTWRADERFVMCSTFKASLAACVLSRVDRGTENLEQPVHFNASDIPGWHAPVAKANVSKGVLSIREMCEAAVEQSDTTCATILLKRIGGPRALTKFWRSIGDRETRLDDPELELNETPPGGVRNTTTPHSMAGILRSFVLGRVLSEQSRAMLTGWLIGNRTGDNRLRAGIPKSWVIGDRTGSNGTDAAGDIAVIWPRPDAPIIVCAYTRGGSPTSEQLATVFAGIGRAVGEKFA